MQENGQSLISFKWAYDKLLKRLPFMVNCFDVTIEFGKLWMFTKRFELPWVLKILIKWLDLFFKSIKLLISKQQRTLLYNSLDSKSYRV